MNIKNNDQHIRNARFIIWKNVLYNRLIQSHIRDIILLILDEIESEAHCLSVTNLIRKITKYSQIPKV